MSKVIDAKNWSLTPAPDGRRYSKYPDGVISNFDVSAYTSGGESEVQYRIYYPETASWGAWVDGVDGGVGGVTTSVLGNALAGPFAFTDQTDLETGVFVESDAETISTEGHQVQLRRLTSSSNSTTRTAVAVIDGVESTAWSVTTASSSSPAAEYTITTGTSSFDGATANGGSPVEPGSLIYIDGGTRGPLTISNLAGTSLSPITIKNNPASSSPVTVQRSSASSGGWPFIISNCYHIVVDGTGTWVGKDGGAYSGAPAGRTGAGIRVTSPNASDRPSAYYKISGYNMHNQVHKGIMVDATITYTNDGSAGRIGFDFNDHGQPPDCPTRENITFDQCYAVGCTGEGFYCGPNPSLTRPQTGDITISNCLIENTGRDAAECKSVYLGTARLVGNYAINCGVHTFGDQNGQQNGLSVGGNSIFEANYVEESGEVGIRAIAYGDLAGTGPFTAEVFNNIVVRSGQRPDGNTGHGISVASDGGEEISANIYHNTIVDNEGRGVFFSSNASASTCRNNILADNGWGGVSSAPAGSTVENNLETTTASAGFTNAAADDYSLTSGSPARNAATGTSPDEDFAGTSRPQGVASDQGAYEFVE